MSHKSSVPRLYYFCQSSHNFCGRLSSLCWQRGQGNRAYLYGAEYEPWNAPLSAVVNHNVPCAVCYASTRGTVMMIPGKTMCPSSWIREYYGYLMTARDHHHYRTKFECMDRSPQPIPGSASNAGGAVFYHVEARCYGICPPYTDGRELTCTVCTK